LKFLWAPLMDRYLPPFLGRRTGWMLIAQICLIISIAGMGFFDPSKALWLTLIAAIMVAFFSASQDIVVDAYRTDLLDPRERGPGAALYIAGYRIAFVVSGALALFMSDHMPWKTVYLVMASTMLIGVLASLAAPQPAGSQKPPANLKDAVVLPLLDFFSRRGAWEILFFILIYKIDVVMATALTTPFLMSLDFTRTQIGWVFKVFGLLATIVGTLFGGAMMVRLGMKKSLWVFGITQGISGLSFMVLAHLGNIYPMILVNRAESLFPMMVFSIAAENFCSGMGTAAYSAFLMSLCNKKFSATQFALLTSIMALTRTLGVAPAGFMVKAMGWENFFLLATLIAIPSLLMLLRYDRWQQLEEAPAIKI